MLERCWNDAGTMLGRCWNDAGTTLERCWNDAGTMLERRWNDAGTMLERRWNNMGHDMCWLAMPDCPSAALRTIRHTTDTSYNATRYGTQDAAVPVLLALGDCSAVCDCPCVAEGRKAGSQTMLQRCWSDAEVIWNDAGTMLERCWNEAGTMLKRCFS